MSATYISASPTRLISTEEEARAASYLAATRDQLLQAIAGLSIEQMERKPTPDDWSVAELVEHIILVETRVHAVVDAMPGAPVAEPDRNSAQIEEVICTVVPSRAERYKAPPAVSPTGRWPAADVADQFASSRARTIHLLGCAPCLRGHVMPHPILGLWDGYQFILATAAHSSRHTHQILEVKSQLGFPSAT